MGLGNPASATTTCLLCGLPSETVLCSYCTLSPKPSKAIQGLNWPPSANNLHELYHESVMSVHAIANLYCKPYSSMIYWMYKHGIEMREREDAARIVVRRYPIRPWSSSLEDKAYVFGLGQGDLNVERKHKSIAVSTSTSVLWMVEVVSDAFMKYARPSLRPTIYKLNGKVIGGWRIRFFLDESFGFLLDKYNESIPRWITGSTALTFAFLAGLFDAEGHVGIYTSKGSKGGPVVQLTFTNANARLVNWLYRALKSRGFPVSLRSQEASGSLWYTVTLQQLEYVQKLLKMMPFRHPKKKAVARLLLSMKLDMNPQLKLKFATEYKMLKKAMKRDDRAEGETSICKILGAPRAPHSSGSLVNNFMNMN